MSLNVLSQKSYTIMHINFQVRRRLNDNYFYLKIIFNTASQPA
jgi:hypothetical protein